MFLFCTQVTQKSSRAQSYLDTRQTGERDEKNNEFSLMLCFKHLWTDDTGDMACFEKCPQLVSVHHFMFDQMFSFYKSF